MVCGHPGACYKLSTPNSSHGYCSLCRELAEERRRVIWDEEAKQMYLRVRIDNLEHQLTRQRRQLAERLEPIWRDDMLPGHKERLIAIVRELRGDHTKAGGEK